MTAFNINIVGNTITISDGIAGLKNVNVPIIGGAGGNAQWNNDIFFSFYTRNFMGGQYTYSTYAIDGYTFNAHDIGMMLAMLFPNFYNNANANTIQADYPEFGSLFARLNGTDITIAPSYEFALDFDDTVYTPSGGGSIDKNNAIGCAFIHFGVGAASSNLNNEIGNFCTSTYGVHLTSANPTIALERQNDGYYDCTQGASVQQPIYIVYTNLFSNAFSNGGMIHPFQFLSIWPIMARKLKSDNPTKNPIAFIDTLFDTSWLRRGVSTYFDRTARKDTTYGCFGNYFMSIFNYNPLGLANSWDIPIVPIFMNFPEYVAIKRRINTLSNDSNVSTTWGTMDNLYSSGYQGGLLVPPFNYIYTGNVKANDRKVFRRLIMYYCAAIERGIAEANTFGTTFVDNTENAILTYNPTLTLNQFYSSGASLLDSGEYAHFFKYAISVPYTPSGGALTNVFEHFVAPYISWAQNVRDLATTLPLTKNFQHGQVQTFGASTIANTGLNTIKTNWGITNMSNAERQDVENYVYTP